MKAKKIIERIFKVINIIMNLMFSWIAFGGACYYGTTGYLYTDTIQRIPWIIVMIIVTNVCDYFIRKTIKDF